MSRLVKLCVMHQEVSVRIKRAVTEDLQAFLAKHTLFDAVSWRLPSSGVEVFDFALRAGKMDNYWIRYEEAVGKPAEHIFVEARTIITSVPRHIHTSVFGAMKLQIVYDKSVTVGQMTQPVFQEIA